MIGTAEQDAFVRRHVYGVVTVLRADGMPSNSVVYCATDGDDVIFSTTEDRYKTKALDRNPRVAVTLLDEGSPHGHVTVEGHAKVQRENIVPPHVKIVKALRGPEWEPPETYPDRLAKERRVLVRVTPQRVTGMLRQRRS